MQILAKHPFFQSCFGILFFFLSLNAFELEEIKIGSYNYPENQKHLWIKFCTFFLGF